MEIFSEKDMWILLAIMVWVLPWKGYALWQAVKLSHKWWFVVLLVLNTLAVLDIIYIFFVARKGKELGATLFNKAE